MQRLGGPLFLVRLRPALSWLQDALKISEQGRVRDWWGSPCWEEGRYVSVSLHSPFCFWAVDIDISAFGGLFLHFMLVCASGFWFCFHFQLCASQCNGLAHSLSVLLSCDSSFSVLFSLCSPRYHVPTGLSTHPFEITKQSVYSRHIFRIAVIMQTYWGQLYAFYSENIMGLFTTAKVWKFKTLGKLIRYRKKKNVIMDTREKRHSVNALPYWFSCVCAVLSNIFCKV